MSCPYCTPRYKPSTQKGYPTAMTSLNAFGAVLTYAIAMEAQLRDYYQAAGQTELARDADKRRSTLERVRRENVTEIKLEPIKAADIEKMVAAHKGKVVVLDVWAEF